MHGQHLKEESGGSRFMTVRSRVRRPFFPSHTRLLQEATRRSEHYADPDGHANANANPDAKPPAPGGPPRYLSVLTKASTSGILAFRAMALSSFSSWVFRSRYLFLGQGQYSS